MPKWVGSKVKIGLDPVLRQPKDCTTDTDTIFCKRKIFCTKISVPENGEEDQNDF